MNRSITENSSVSLREKNQRIILAMIEAGGGHKSPAIAVTEAMQRLYPDAYDLLLMDFMRGTGCTKLDVQHKQSWEFLLEHPILCRSGELITEFTGPVFRFGLKYYLTPFYDHVYEFLLEHQPGLVFSTHPFNTIALDQVRKKFGLSFLLVNYLTELFDASALWVLKDVDYFLVPTEEAKSRLLKRGISAEKLRVFDFPIRSSFFDIREVDEKEIALNLGLDPDKKTLLMSTGGQGNGNLFKFLDVLIEEHMPLNIIACTGKNEELRTHLVSEYEGKGSSIRLKVFGFTSRMHELMKASDFCFIKPGPNTTIEAMVLQKPMIFARHVHQGEKANIEFAEAHRIGFATGDNPRSFLEIVKLLMDWRTYSDIKSNFRSIVIRNGAEDIARFISALMEKQP